MSLAKRYDPLTKVFSNSFGNHLFFVSPPVIKEVFGLSKNNALLERIDLS